ncbi:MAG TPA: hypothetical protein VIY49_38055 [Bryobacteraceae bacterium]
MYRLSFRGSARAGRASLAPLIWNRRIIVEKSGSEATVIWNPWIDKAKGMSDMAPDEWPEMICVETANAADNALRLSAGGSHKLKTSIRLESVGP